MNHTTVAKTVEILVGRLEVVTTDLGNALAVIVTDPHTRAWLAVNDPQALAQARAALRNAGMLPAREPLTSDSNVTTLD